MHRRVLGEERRGGVQECRGGVEEVGKGGGREQHLEAESGGEEGGLEEQHHQVPHRLVVLDGVHALLVHDGVRERWSRSCRGGRRAGAWQGSGSGAAAARASPRTPDRRRRRRMGKEGEEYREEWEDEEGLE